MNFGRFGKIASVSLIGAMLLAGCSGNGQTVMKIGDTNITEGAVNFFANYGMGTEDVDAAVDNLKHRLGFAITQCLPFSDSRPDAPVLSL